MAHTRTVCCTSFDGTYMYGMSWSSHSTGRWVTTSMGEISPAIIQILQEHEIVSSPKGAPVDMYSDTACVTHPWVFFRKALTTSLTPRLICFLLAPFLANFSTFLQSLSSASGLAMTLTADFFAMAPSAIANQLPNCVHQCDSCCN